MRITTLLFVAFAPLYSILYAQTAQIGAQDAFPIRTIGASKDAEQTKCFVLTRLGAIHEGELQDRGNAYLLEFPGGGSTTISKLDAVYIGSSRESIYRYKLSQTAGEDVNELLKLADWASRRQLSVSAIATLKERLENSTDPGERAALQRKIGELERAEAFRENVARSNERRATNASPNVSSRVVNVKTLSPEDAELEDWAKGVPLPTLERFSRKAQPVLQKRCATSECHEVGSSSRFLLRPKTAGTAARFALIYNLRATIEHVDFDDIEKSPILVHPTVVDAAGERVYPFGSDRSSLKDCEAFVKWLKSLPTEKVLASHAKATKRDLSGPLLRKGAVSRYDVVDREANQEFQKNYDDRENESFNALFEQESERKAEPTVATNEQGRLGFGVSQEAQRYISKPEDDPNSEEAVLQRGGLKPKNKYRDEYDPARFNDRYHSK